MTNASLVLALFIAACPVWAVLRVLRDKCARGQQFDTPNALLFVVSCGLLAAVACNCMAKLTGHYVKADDLRLAMLSLLCLVTYVATGMISGRGSGLRLALLVGSLPVAISLVDYLVAQDDGLFLIELALAVTSFVMCALDNRRFRPVGNRFERPGFTYCIALACRKLGQTKFIALIVAIVVVFVAAGMSIFNKFSADNTADGIMRIAFFICCCIYTSILLLWVVFARSFVECLTMPIRLWNDDAYNQDMADHAAGCRMPPDEGGLSVEAKSRTRKYAAFCCAAFWVLWIIYIAFAVYCVFQLSIPLPCLLLLATLAALSLLLNGASYYLCMRFVWLLKKIAACATIKECPHVPYDPVHSNYYQRLLSAARANSLFFFGVVLLFSLALLVGLVMFQVGPGDVGGQPEAGASAMVVLAVCCVSTFIAGPVGFGAIYLSSKVFLGKLLDVWRLHDAAVVEIERARVVAWMPDGGSLLESTRYRDLLNGIFEHDKMSRTDLLTILLAALSLAANVAAVVVAMRLS